MAAGQTIRLTSDINRARACRWCQTAPHGAICNIREATRTNEQNARMWAMLSDVSRAKPDGREHTPDVWKSLFLHSLDHAQRFEMALDGKGMGTKNSDRYAIPLCSAHHGEQHARGWKTFERNYGIASAPGVAERYWKAWPGRVAWERKQESRNA